MISGAMNAGTFTMKIPVIKSCCPECSWWDAEMQKKIDAMIETDIDHAIEEKKETYD